MAEPTILLDIDDGVATVTLNRPEKLNAISPQMWDEPFFTGDAIDGAKAERIGLVDEVMPAGELDAVTLGLCRRIAQMPTDALNLHKHVINRWAEIMGLRLGALEGAEFDAMFHLTEARAEFGLETALAWRDGPFASIGGRS